MAKILYVDDNPLMRKVVSAYLDALGHETQCAENAEKGMELLDKYSAHLVITDYHMPGKNGLEFCGDIKKKNPDIPVILISALADQIADDPDMRLAERGVSCLLCKPVSLVDFSDAITSILLRNQKIEDDKKSGKILV